jgi:hypothetical protein
VVEDLGKWANIIKAVKNRLTLLALIVLVVGSALGTVARRSAGQTQMLSVAGIIFLMTVLICVVFWLEYDNNRSPAAAAKPGLAQAEAVAQVCRSIEGNWWDRLTNENLSALAIVTIEYQAIHNTVHIKGKSCNEEDGLVAR